MPLWGGEFPGLTASYCRQACGDRVCEACPRPRLLPDAIWAAALYRAVQTQWAVAPYMGYTGLRYEACLPMLEHKRAEWLAAGEDDVPDPGVLMADLQVIEAAVLAAQAERRAPEGIAHGRT